MGVKGAGKAWIRNNLEIRGLIAEQEAFKAKNGNLIGIFVDGLMPEDGYGLVGLDMDTFLDDGPYIEYVVYSYDTPIHWVSEMYGWYTIANPPSKTTAGHRNLCPGYGKTREPGWTYPRNPDGTRRRVRKETT